MNGALLARDVGLFKADDRSGAHWLFRVSERGWTVTRNGVRMFTGQVDAGSLDAGLREFQSLARGLARKYPLKNRALLPLAS